MTTHFTKLSGSGLFAKAARGLAFVASGFVLAQGMRFASNLLLTRLLFPEAFGLMALVSMVMVGLSMFSDVGLGPSIQSSRRGDDPAFLDTAYSVQVLRGALLWLLGCAFAWPLASFYDAPEMIQILPVAAFASLIAGLAPIRVETANRHLALGRVTAIDLVSQAIGILIMIGLALWTKSVWSLVWGNIATAAVRLWLIAMLLPGPPSRFRWEAESVRELLRYGGWIFLSTAFGFLLSQGDKAILGRYLTLESLGVYNIGYFLASFPAMLLSALVARTFIPIYREVAASGSAQSRRRLRKMRFTLTGTVLLLMAAIALGGRELVAFLYDARYAGAGAVVVAIVCLQLPHVVMATYDSSALAAGDSRGFFLLSAVKAVLQTTLFLIGAHYCGLAGALLGQGAAAVLMAPATMLLAARHKAHDPLHDLCFGLAAAGIAALALSRAAEDLRQLTLL